MDVIIAGTGHRPDKLTPGIKDKYLCYSDEVLSLLIELAQEELKRLKPVQVITGGALGWDTALAIAAIRENIPLVVAVPFSGQESQWPEKSQKLYNRILAKAWKVVIVSEGGFTREAMQKRNEFMVDHATHILALHNGTLGGTKNCLVYAQKVAKPIRNVWPLWVPRLQKWLNQRTIGK